MVVILSKIEGKAVTQIGDSAFSVYGSEIKWTSMDIKNRLTSIHRFMSITSITIQSNINKIGNYAFLWMWQVNRCNNIEWCTRNTNWKNLLLVVAKL